VRRFLRTWLLLCALVACGFDAAGDAFAHADAAPNGNVTHEVCGDCCVAIAAAALGCAEVSGCHPVAAGTPPPYFHISAPLLPPPVGNRPQ
jgi:hypothetical protein